MNAYNRFTDRLYATPGFRIVDVFQNSLGRVSLAAIIGRLRARVMKINTYSNSAKAEDSRYVLLLRQNQPLLKTVNFSSSFFN